MLFLELNWLSFVSLFNSYHGKKVFGSVFWTILLRDWSMSVCKGVERCDVKQWRHIDSIKDWTKDPSLNCPHVKPFDVQVFALDSYLFTNDPSVDKRKNPFWRVIMGFISSWMVQLNYKNMNSLPFTSQLKNHWT